MNNNKWTKELQEFLKFYLPNNALEPFLEKFSKISIKKNDHLLQPGMHCAFLCYIQEGAFRVYYYDQNGKEIITWFSFQDMVVTDLLGFYQGGLSNFYVQAIEDSTLYKITKQSLNELYIKYPEFRRFGQFFAEEALTMLMERTISLHTKSAEERYLELLQIPNFTNKVPLKYIASFLGITDTSLSRIRRNMQ